MSLTVAFPDKAEMTMKFEVSTKLNIPACVRMVLEQYGDPRPEAEVALALGCAPSGTPADSVRCVQH